jgi:enoyl-CoA hydratase/carnithine racemase
MSNAVTKYQKDKHVAALTITEVCTNLEKLGVLSDELSNLRFRILSDADVRVIVLTGLGHIEFSIGDDLLKKTKGLSEKGFDRIQEVGGQIAGIDRPVIAAISGNAVGLGLELALACDIRIAAENSWFGLPHVKEGLIPWDGGTQRLSRLAGKGKALEMILTGDVIDAQEALRIGLVNRVVPKGDVSKVIMELAKDMVSKSPIATRYAKEAICKGMELSLDQGLRLEADLYFLLHTTKDRTEGIRAFQEKRKAHFEGR